MPITTCVFDAYGTLFDVAAAAREAAAEPGREAFAEHWPAIAKTWRLKQLQYTWLRATAGVHQDFWTVTQDGLDYAMEEQGLDDADLRARLLQLYWELSCYQEVPAMLGALKAAGMNTAILSNGTPDMLEGAVQAAGIGDVLDACLSVQSLGVFKPSRAVYGLVGEYFGCAAQRSAVRLVELLGRLRRVRLSASPPSGRTGRGSRWTDCPGNRTHVVTDLTGMSPGWRRRHERGGHDRGYPRRPRTPVRPRPGHTAAGEQFPERGCRPSGPGEGRMPAAHGFLQVPWRLVGGLGAGPRRCARSAR